MKKILGLGISHRANQELKKAKELSIHSKFEQSMNVLSGNNLIYIGERALPFGLKIQNYEDIKKADDVFYQAGQLIFLNQDHECFISVHDLPLIKDHHKGILKCLKEKYEVLKDMVELKPLKDLTDYLGRGQGLTPSGDDFIVGLYLVSFCNTKVKELIKELEQVDFKEYTTTISAEYLNAAKEGHFNPDLLELLACKNMNKFKYLINTILDIGHSSGRDTLEGVLVGLDIILKEEKHENENCSSTGW